MTTCSKEIEIALCEQRLLGHELYEQLCEERNKIYWKYAEAEWERMNTEWNLRIKALSRPSMIFPEDYDPGVVIPVDGPPSLLSRIKAWIKP